MLPLLKTKLPFPKPAAKTLFADERNVLTARIAALLDENNQLLRELAFARTERDALERALNALKRNQKSDNGHEAG
jgi:FtsZ-binding cell division protein ZapB